MNFMRSVFRIAFVLLNTLASFLLYCWKRRFQAGYMSPYTTWFARDPSNSDPSLICFRHLRVGNYRRFLKIVAADSSYLQFCLLEPVVNEVKISC